jgi:hypothetical protein
MEYTNSANDNLVSYEIQINLNMLSVLILNQIDEKIDNTDVVTVDKHVLLNRLVKLVK